MRYAYYPGCSLAESAGEYDVSTRLVMECLGATLVDVPDWTCCGASAVESVSRLLAFALPARNMALAQSDGREVDMLVPCSACYLNLRRVQEETVHDRALAHDLEEVLSAESLTYNGTVRVRHLLDVLGRDFGPGQISHHVTRPLEGLAVAPYYGCQILRPYEVFDDPERPVSMEPLLKAAGADVHPWSAGNICCGASLMATEKDVALVSVARILEAARGADVIATVCPLCQMNLEAYQSEAIREGGMGRPVTVLYLPQLLGLAMGFSPKQMLLDKGMSMQAGTRRKISELLKTPRQAAEATA